MSVRYASIFGNFADAVFTLNFAEGIKNIYSFLAVFLVTVLFIPALSFVNDMILVNTDYITGKELEMLGLVRGSTIQSKNIGKDIAQSFKTIVGGELKAYTEMMNEARAVATDRMVAEAERMGADAVVNIRYASSSVMQGAAEVIAYGTAVRFIVK